MLRYACLWNHLYSAAPCIHKVLNSLTCSNIILLVHYSTHIYTIYIYYIIYIQSIYCIILSDCMCIYILYHHIHHVRPCDFLRSVTVTFLAETGRLQEGGHEATSLADSGALFCVPRHPNVVTFKHHGWMSLIIDHGSANRMTL